MTDLNHHPNPSSSSKKHIDTNGQHQSGIPHLPSNNTVSKVMLPQPNLDDLKMKYQNLSLEELKNKYDTLVIAAHNNELKQHAMLEVVRERKGSSSKYVVPESLKEEYKYFFSYELKNKYDTLVIAAHNNELNRDAILAVASEKRDLPSSKYVVPESLKAEYKTLSLNDLDKEYNEFYRVQQACKNLWKAIDADKNTERSLDTERRLLTERSSLTDQVLEAKFMQQTIVDVVCEKIDWTNPSHFKDISFPLRTALYHIKNKTGTLHNPAPNTNSTDTKASLSLETPHERLKKKYQDFSSEGLKLKHETLVTEAQDNTQQQNAIKNALAKKRDHPLDRAERVELENELNWLVIAAHDIKQHRKAIEKVTREKPDLNVSLTGKTAHIEPALSATRIAANIDLPQQDDISIQTAPNPNDLASFKSTCQNSSLETLRKLRDGLSRQIGNKVGRQHAVTEVISEKQGLPPSKYVVPEDLKVEYSKLSLENLSNEHRRLENDKQINQQMLCVVTEVISESEKQGLPPSIHQEIPVLSLQNHREKMEPLPPNPRLPTNPSNTQAHLDDLKKQYRNLSLVALRDEHNDLWIVQEQLYNAEWEKSKQLPYAEMQQEQARLKPIQAYNKQKRGAIKKVIDEKLANHSPADRDAFKSGLYSKTNPGDTPTTDHATNDHATKTNVPSSPYIDKGIFSEKKYQKRSLRSLKDERHKLQNEREDLSDQWDRSKQLSPPDRKLEQERLRSLQAANRRLQRAVGNVIHQKEGELEKWRKMAGWAKGVALLGVTAARASEEALKNTEMIRSKATQAAAN